MTDINNDYIGTLTVAQFIITVIFSVLGFLLLIAGILLLVLLCCYWGRPSNEVHAVEENPKYQLEAPQQISQQTPQQLVIYTPQQPPVETQRTAPNIIPWEQTPSYISSVYSPPRQQLAGGYETQREAGPGSPVVDSTDLVRRLLANNEKEAALVVAQAAGIVPRTNRQDMSRYGLQ